MVWTMHAEYSLNTGSGDASRSHPFFYLHGHFGAQSPKKLGNQTVYFIFLVCVFLLFAALNRSRMEAFCQTKWLHWQWLLYGTRPHGKCQIRTQAWSFALI